MLSLAGAKLVPGVFVPHFAGLRKRATLENCTNIGWILTGSKNDRIGRSQTLTSRLSHMLVRRIHTYIHTYIHTFIDHFPKGAFQCQLQRKR